MKLAIFAASNMEKAVPFGKWNKTLMTLLTFVFSCLSKMCEKKKKV
jgi:hypothetical protein